MATGSCGATTKKTRLPGRESAKLVYGANSPYARQPELATIGAVTVDDLKAWHERTLGGKLIVAVSGGLRPGGDGSQAAGVFEGLPKVKAAPARHEAFAGPKPGVYFIDKEDVNQSTWRCGDGHGPAAIPMFRAGEMNEILGGGFCQPVVPEDSDREGPGPTRSAAA